MGLLHIVTCISQYQGIVAKLARPGKTQICHRDDSKVSYCEQKNGDNRRVVPYSQDRKDPDEQANGYIGVLRGCFHVDHTNVIIGQEDCLAQLEIWGVAYEPEVHRFLVDS